MQKVQAASAGLWRAAFREGFLFIPLAALVACMPRIVRGVSCGHDFEFHLISWMETQRAWSQGVLYPHWAQSPNWGAGEPRFVFYPPLTWMLGAALGYLMHWKLVPAVFTYLCLAGTGFTTRTLAREFLPASTATLAGVIATAAPYALFAAYERTAFSELAAAALIPLLLLYALRCQSQTIGVAHVSRPEPDSGAARTLFPVALILALVWLTNAPAGVMASYLLAFAAVAAAFFQRSWRPILRAAIAAMLALGLDAFYLIPAAWEQRWIAIHQALDVGMRIRDSWLFARHSSPDLALHDQVLRVSSTILVFTAACALAGLAIAVKNRKLSNAARHLWMPIAALIPIILILQFPISAPLWNLPKLQFLQFPWRWLIVLDVPFAIFLAAATPLGTRRSRIGSAVGWMAILLIFSTVASVAFFQFCDEEDDVDNQISIFHDGSGVEGIDEYAPLGSDNTLVASSLPDACLVRDPTRDLGEGKSGAEPVWRGEQGSCDQTSTALLWQNEHKILQIYSDHAGFVVLRLRRYPAWQVIVNRQPVTQVVSREDGLMAVPVAAGPSSIEVRWAATPDVRWGRWISRVTLALFVALWIAERRMKAIRLSSN